MSRVKKAPTLEECLECLRVLSTRLGQDKALDYWKDELRLLWESVSVNSFEPDGVMYKQALAALDRHLDKMPLQPDEADGAEWLIAANNFSRALDPSRFAGPLVAELQPRTSPSSARKRDRLKNWRAERHSQRVSKVRV